MALSFHMMPTRDTEVQQRVGDMLARHLAAANLLGRVQIVKRAHRLSGHKLPIAASSRHVGFGDDDDDLYGSFATDLPNDDAAGYLADLTPVTKEIFDGLSSQYKKDAFTLAGAADVRLIGKIRDALADAAQKGETADEFELAAKKITDDAGVAELSSFTLDVAFNTAMQKAFSLGRWEQIQDPATKLVLPFLQYWTVGDDHVRPEHAVLDGFVARVDDPVWLKIYPPNGFGCRCSGVPVPEAEALKADKDANEPGYARLPLLARLLVPQPGFAKVFSE
jgi:SPP1 gp7 family putative phage head morphogenesis protein